MIFKIKEFSLIIFLILLQSCSGGRIGNFLESSFDNFESINTKLESKNILENRKVFNSEKKEINKKNIEKMRIEEKPKNILENRKVFNSEKKEINKKNIEKMRIEEKPKNILENRKVFNSEKKSDKTIKANKKNKSSKKVNNDLQSYKIIFILKDVDPKDPIEELSTILRDSEVNFEIEKIERFLESKTKSIKRN